MPCHRALPSKSSSSSLTIISQRHEQDDEETDYSSLPPVPPKNKAPSIKSTKSFKTFFQGRSLAKSSSSTRLRNGNGIKDFFQFSAFKKENASKRSSLISVCTSNSNTSLVSTTHNSLGASCTSLHDSLFLAPLSPPPTIKESYQPKRGNDTFPVTAVHTINNNDCDSNNMIAPKTEPQCHDQQHQKRSSVRLLGSPTTKNTVIRMSQDCSLLPASHDWREPITCDNEKARDTMEEDEHILRGRRSALLLDSQRNQRHNTKAHRQRLTHQRSVSPTVVSIHTEHAAPTFIRSSDKNNKKATGLDRLSSTTAAPFSSHEESLKVNHSQGLKSYRSDGDLRRLRSLFISSAARVPPSPSSSTSSFYSGKHTIKAQKPTSVASCSSSSRNTDSHSFSSMLRPLIPQSSPSTRIIHKSSCSDLRKLHDQQPISGKSDSNPWQFLRHVKRNASSLALKKVASESAATCAQDNEYYKRYSPFVENSISNSSEGSVLHLSENGQDVLIMERVGGRFNVVAGTAEKLFIKLADETSQDFDYIDAFILMHTEFTTSEDFLENLMARFHIEPQPGETEYFRKWQRCIQIKVLNVIARWIKTRYHDFKANPILLTRLRAFISGDITRGRFVAEANNLKELLHTQAAQHSQKRSQYLQSQLEHRRHLSHHDVFTLTTELACKLPLLHSPILVLESKDMAQYLTLADFYLLKCITTYDYLRGHWRSHRTLEPRVNSQYDHDYVDMMTKRANMLSHWTKNEICLQETSKQRTNVFQKLIEVANLCSEWNNFHTSMIITASLSQLGEKADEWSMISTRHLHMYQKLSKLLDVTNNMSYYRQQLGKAKSPTVPFFPLLLKDLIFFMDGNPNHTALTSSTSTSSSIVSSTSSSTRSSMSTITPPSTNHSSSSSTSSLSALINFAKYRSLTRYVHGILSATSEDYWFATDLGPWLFLHEDVTHNNECTTPILSVPASSSSTSPPSLPLNTMLPLDSVAFQLEHSLWSTQPGKK